MSAFAMFCIALPGAGHYNLLPVFQPYFARRAALGCQRFEKAGVSFFKGLGKDQIFGKREQHHDADT